MTYYGCLSIDDKEQFVMREFSSAQVKAIARQMLAYGNCVTRYYSAENLQTHCGFSVIHFSDNGESKLLRYIFYVSSPTAANRMFHYFGNL